MSIQRWVLVASLLGAACGGESAGGAGALGVGSEGRACFPNDSCNAGLTCTSSVCVAPSGLDAAFVDASTGGRGGMLHGGGGAGDASVSPFDASPFRADGGSTVAWPSAEGGTARSCGATEVLLDGACVPLAEPCTAVGAGYAGDYRCLTPPDAAVGFQLHYGPTSYDDPNEVAKYLVAPGSESNVCLFRKTPNATTVHAGAFRVSSRPGVFRLTVNTQSADVPDSTGPEACQPYSAMIVDVSNGDTTIELGGNPAAPEHAGSGLQILAHAQAALQARSVNTTDQPLLAEGWVNVGVIPEAHVTTEIAFMTFAAGLGMNIPPHTRSLITSGTQSCSLPASASASVELRSLTADTASHTERISAFVVRGTAKTEVYTSFDWSNPFTAVYDSTRSNPRADLATKISGASSGDLVLQAGDQIAWECDINNDLDSNMHFSNDVFGGDMCVLVGYYAKGTDLWSCARN